MTRRSFLTSLVSLLALFIWMSGALLPIVQVYAQVGFNVVINQIDSSAFPQITAYVTVSDPNGLPITDLASDSFEVVEDATLISGVAVTATQSTSEPIVLVIALDLSGSMAGIPLSNTLGATASLIDKLGPADEIALITFSDKATVVLPLTNDKAQAKSVIGTLSAKGDTALWDAVHEASSVLAVRPPGRRAVVIVTDGKDTNSLLTLEDVTGEAERQDLPVFPIGFGNVDREALERLARITGGEAFISPDSDQLATQFDTIIGRLRQQYVVTYTSAALVDGAEHQVLVRVKHLGAQAEGSKAFTPPPIPCQVSLPDFTDGQQVGIGMPTGFTPQFSPYAAITSVDYQLDGVKLATISVKPFEYVWTPARADTGLRTLTVRATDAVGSVCEDSVSLEVVPAVAVSIISPQEGDVISGTVTLQAEVTALSMVSSVDFLIDGNSVGTVTSAPYALEWDSASVPAGDHELTVVVKDVNGQSAEARLPMHIQVGINWGLFGAIALVLIAIGIILPFSLRSRRQRGTPPKPAVRGEPEAQAQSGAAIPVAEARLIIEAGDGQGQSWPLGMGETRIGRQRSENDVILSGSDVSRRHAVIRFSDGKYVYVHLSQTSSSAINGEPVSNQRPLADGDRIEIGDFVLRFVSPKQARNV